MAAPYQDLHDRALKTSSIRFRAAQRLAVHYQLSQWVITLASILLIAIPILQAFSVEVRYTAGQLNAIQALLAVLVLAYSLLLTQQNFAVRSERMHTCGMELNQLAMRIRRCIAAAPDDVTEYDRLAEQYHFILSKHENHAEPDHILYKMKKQEDQYAKWQGRAVGRLKIVAYSSAAFAHYVILLLLLGFVLVKVVGATFGV